MDFVIRECLAVVEGPLAMIRLGTCGAIQPPAHLGNFLVASQGSGCVRYSQTLALQRTLASAHMVSSPQITGVLVPTCAYAGGLCGSLMG